jgi:hypothetical protein
MMIDSLEMTGADRAIIVEQCRQAAEPRLVITHGTDTMVETARALAAALDPMSGKTVVLTGAMIPYAFGSSDGLFNLGSALSFVQVLPPGVYLAMNGRCFAWDCVRKNKETRRIRVNVTTSHATFIVVRSLRILCSLCVLSVPSCGLCAVGTDVLAGDGQGLRLLRAYVAIDTSNPPGIPPKRRTSSLPSSSVKGSRPRGTSRRRASRSSWRG